jgi:uncharacterized protein (TIGR00255 family)
MTGYGAASVESEALRATVVVRSLNHRFLDLALHLPRRLQPLETELKERVAAVVARGRLEVTIQASLPEAPGEAVVACRPLVASLVRTLRDMQNEHGLEGGASVADLVRFPGALERVESAPAVTEEVRTTLAAVLGRAVESLEAMRRAEGLRLQAELERRLGAIEEMAARIATRAEESRESRRATLLERVRSLVGELGLDDARLYQEVVRAVERHDVSEEVQRLRSHAESARDLVKGDGVPAGKRLDFLAQELMREANTLGSKVQDAPAVREVVELKAEIERLREQVQNVE